MASNQFNSWEPVLDAVNGRMQQEPRVFAHDAVSVTTGAVNTTWGDGGVSALTNPGTGYAVASGVATTVAPCYHEGITESDLSRCCLKRDQDSCKGMYAVDLCCCSVLSEQVSNHRTPPSMDRRS